MKSIEFVRGAGGLLRAALWSVAPANHLEVVDYQAPLLGTLDSLRGG